MENFLVNKDDLSEFLKEALENCYLGEFKKAGIIERPGFFEMNYSKNGFDYRDSFTGFYLSAGQEIIRYKNIPIWSSSYRGGVIDDYIGNLEFFRELEDFLRKSLSIKKNGEFTPRGPRENFEGDFKYLCNWTGDINEFSGLEEIFYKDQKVFYHIFFGGSIIGKNQ